MMILYAMAAVALTLVGYLAHDFYNEQLRERMIPIRSGKQRQPNRPQFREPLF